MVIIFFLVSDEPRRQAAIHSVIDISQKSLLSDCCFSHYYSFSYKILSDNRSSVKGQN